MAPLLGLSGYGGGLTSKLLFSTKILVEYYWLALLDASSPVSINDIASDINGNIFSVGLLGSDILFTKHNASGEFIFQKTINTISNNTDVGNAVEVDALGNVYIAVSINTNTNEDITLLKYTNQGDILWSLIIEGSSTDQIKSLSIDNSNNVYLVGFTNSSGEGGSDIFIAKCNSSGNLLWQRTLGGTGTDRLNDIVCDSSGNFYVVGESNSNPSNNYNIFIKKYDSNGNDVWEKVLKSLSGSPPNLYGNSIALDDQNNIHIAGYSDFDTTNNILLFKLSSDGIVNWYEVLGGSGSDIAEGISVDSFGNVYITGSTSSQGSGNNDAFIVKYNSSGTIQWQRTLGYTGDDYGYSVKVISKLEIAIVGKTTQGSNTNGFILKVPADGSLIGAYDGLIYQKLSLSDKTLSSSLLFSDQLFLSKLDGSSANAIAVDSINNIYICGEIFNGIDTIIAKYDTSGTIQWQRSLGGTGNDYSTGIAVDSSGNAHITGYTNSQGAGGNDVFIAKYDTSGTLQWQRTLGGTGDDEGNGIAVDSFGNTYIVGNTFSQGAGQNDVLIAKYNSSGIIQWQRTLGGTSFEVGNGIALDSSANVYITGYTNTQGAGSSDFIIAKYDTSGTLQWQRTLGGTNFDRGYGIAVDSSGNVYIVGQTNSQGAGNWDVLIAKYNSSGTLQWQRILGGTSDDVGHGITVDSSGNVYITGYTRSQGAGSYDVLIAKYNTSGTLQWQRTLGASGTGLDTGYGITLDSFDNIYISGFADGGLVIVKLDPEGSLIGDIGNLTLAVSTLTSTTSTLTAATSTLTDTTSTLTGATSTLTVATSTLTNVINYFKTPPTFYDYYYKQFITNSIYGGLVTDSSGNYYCVNDGYFTAARIQKFNKYGDLIWAKTVSGFSYSGSPYHITLSYDEGYVYICGDKGNGTNRGFIGKFFTSNGNTSWQKELSYNQPVRMVVDSSENLYVCLNSSGGIQWSPGSLAKFNSSGTLQWQKDFGKDSAVEGVQFYGLGVDSSGNVYASGGWGADFLSDTAMQTFKFDTNGNLLWQKYVTGTNTAGYYSHTGSLDSSNNFYSVGRNRNINEFLVMKYNTSGTVVWQRTLTLPTTFTTNLNSIFAQKSVIDSSSNLYILFKCDSKGAVVVKINSSGTLLWQKIFYGPNAFTTSDGGIDIDSDGNLYIASEEYIIKYDSSGSFDSKDLLEVDDFIFTYATSSYNGSTNTSHTVSNLSITIQNFSLSVSDDTTSITTTPVNYKVPEFSTISSTGYTGIKWIKVLGSSVTSNAIAVDSSNNVYIVGETFINVDAIIAKYNSSGTLQWQRSLGGTGNDYLVGIAVDSSGNAYIVGRTDSQGAGSSDILIAKYNTSGTIQWQRTLGGTGDDEGNGIAVDSSGNAYIVGNTFSQGAGQNDVLIAKYNSSGTLQWQRTLGGTSFEVGNGIALDSSNNVYIVGRTGSQGAGSNDVLIAKYNTSGTLLWQRTLGESIIDRGHGITVDSSGNVYIVGQTNSQFGSADFDVLVAKYDTNGTIQWQRILRGGTGFDNGYGIALDSSGNVYIVGHTNSQGAGLSDAFIAKYNTSGTLQWQRVLGRTDNDFGYGIAVDSFDNIYISGFSSSGSLTAKLDSSGSLIGTMGDFVIQESTFTESAFTLTSSTSTLTDTTSTLTSATSTLTSATSTLTDITLYESGNLSWITTDKSYAENFTVDSSGNVYTVGSKNNTTDPIVSKYNSFGIIQWQRVLDSTNSDEGYAIAVDSSSNVYITGYTQSQGAGSYDVLIAKYNTSGTLQWQRTLGGTSEDIGRGIAVDSSGNVYIVGETFSQGAGNYDVLIAKYNTSGTLQWQRTLGGTSADSGRGITVDSSGNVYIVGRTQSQGAGSYDVLIAKYDTSGNLLWQKTLGGTSAELGRGITVDSSGNVYIVGETFSQGAGSYDVLIAKYDTSGNLLWQKTLGGTGNDYGRGIALDSYGDVYIVGFNGSSGSEDSFIAKCSNSAGGFLLWQKSISGVGPQIVDNIKINNDNLYLLIDSNTFNHIIKLDISAPQSLNMIDPLLDREIIISNSTLTSATSTLTDATSTLTSASSTLTSATSTFTPFEPFYQYSTTPPKPNYYDVGGSIITTNSSEPEFLYPIESNDTELWVTTLGGTSIENTNGIAVDSSGNVYIIGRTNSQGAGSSNILIAKYNTSGTLQWQRTLGRTGSDFGGGITVDSSGNVYITGFTYSQGAGSSDVLIAKHDTSGTLQWQRTLGGTGEDIIGGIALDSSGNVYITGHTYSQGAGSYDVLIAKYNTSGTLQWQRTLGGTSGDLGYEIALDSSGNVYITGFTTSQGAGSSDVLIAKYDTSGTLLWQKTLGGTGNDYGRGIALDSYGDVYITGYTQSQGAGPDDVLIAKYNTSGTLLWQRTLGGTSGDDRGYGIALDSSGNVYITGDTTSQGVGGSDVLIAKYDTSGTLLWQRTLGGTSTELGHGIALDSSGNVYITGDTTVGGSDILIAKLDPKGSLIGDIGNLTLTVSTLTGATSTLTSSTSTLTDATSTLTDVTSTLLTTSINPRTYPLSSTYFLSTLGGTLQDEGHGIALDSSGNVYITGFTTSQGAGSSDVLIAKYNTSGTLQWQRTLGGTGSDEGAGIAVDSSGNVYITGDTFSQGSGNNDAFIVKYNSSGTLQWQRTLGGTSYDEGNGIAVDSSGNVYITGHTGSQGAGNYDVLIAKYNTSGTLQWQRILGGINNDIGSGITVDSSGNVYIVGEATPSLSAILIAKYDTNGTLQWQRTLSGTGSDFGFGITVDSSGNVYIIGRTNSQGAGSFNVLVAKYNTSGTLQWQRILGGTGEDEGRGITVDSSGNAYITGYTTSQGAGSWDVLIAKYNTLGTLQWQRTLGGTGFDRGNEITVDSSDNVYIVGRTDSHGAGQNDVLIAKLDPEGSLIGDIGNLTFAVSSLTSSTSSLTSSTSTLTYATSALTDTTSTLTGATYTLTTNSIRINPLITTLSSKSKTFISHSVYPYQSRSNDVIADKDTGDIYTIAYYPTFSTGLISKYNSSGILQWQKQITMSFFTNSFDDSFAIDFDQSNKILYVIGSDNGEIITITKLSPSGEIVNSVRLNRGIGGGIFDLMRCKVGTDGIYITCENILTRLFKVDKNLNSIIFQTSPLSLGVSNDIALNATNDIYRCGSRTGSVAGTFEVYVSKYNSSGALQWERTLTPGANPNKCSGITLDRFGNVYIAAYVSLISTTHIYIIKYNSSGTLQWQKQLSPAVTLRANSKFLLPNDCKIVCDRFDNVYVVKGIENNRFINYANIPSNNNIFIAKYDSSGNLIWYRYLGSDDGDEIPIETSIDSSDNIIIYGETNSPSNGGNYSEFLLKIDSNGNAIDEEFNTLGLNFGFNLKPDIEVVDSNGTLTSNSYTSTPTTSSFTLEKLPSTNLTSISSTIYYDELIS